MLCSDDSIQRDITTLGLYGVGLIKRSLSQLAFTVEGGGRRGKVLGVPLEILLGCVTL